ncbi:MAG: outer membrane beta-barrel protein [Gemmatimonadota bacterium]
MVMLASGLGANTPLVAQTRFGFTGVLGWESVSGDASQVLQNGVTGEFDVYYHFGHIRTGIGFNVVSYSMDTEGFPPVVAELTEGVSRVTINFLLGYKFSIDGPLRPYVEGRLGYIRLRPEWNYWAEPEQPGENTQDRESGVQYGIRGGLEIPFAERWSADLSATWTTFSISEVSGEVIDIESFDSGSTFGFMLGTSFYP